MRCLSLRLALKIWGALVCFGKWYGSSPAVQSLPTVQPTLECGGVLQRRLASPPVEHYGTEYIVVSRAQIPIDVGAFNSTLAVVAREALKSPLRRALRQQLAWASACGGADGDGDA